jgi:hypothetical protein
VVTAAARLPTHQSASDALGSRGAIVREVNSAVAAPFVIRGLEFAHCSAAYGLECWCFSSANPLM